MRIFLTSKQITIVVVVWHLKRVKAIENEDGLAGATRVKNVDEGGQWMLKTWRRAS